MIHGELLVFERARVHLFIDLFDCHVPAPLASAMETALRCSLCDSNRSVVLISNCRSTMPESFLRELIVDSLKPQLILDGGFAL
ncbi:MAG: hypothetical protein EOQ40_17400 [Mesorhizobium sp.]|uniref:hypothetical protein n=1 Tax=Mesorhizobium sp. TaxID=1871066 RepID=UPI000FE72DCF|nr:hypothetical protein [Mesorhizobium sp.]RWB19911.1 MAG: hypothetical protein EOQ40_17400 [Mesorhizobium sp.]